jgi:integrase
MGSGGAPLSAVDRELSARLPACGKPGRPEGLELHGELHKPHDLRHAFATWLEGAGVPVR